MYTVKQVAKIMGYSVSTVRLRAKDYQDLLSSRANPKPGETRLFTEEDISILKTIKVLQEAAVSKEEIWNRIARGDRLEPEPNVDYFRQERITQAPMPAPISPPANEPNLQLFSGFTTALQAYEKQLSLLQNYNIELTDRIIDAERRASMAEAEVIVLKERLKTERTKTKTASDQVRKAEGEVRVLGEQLSKEQVARKNTQSQLVTTEKRAAELSNRVSSLEAPPEPEAPPKRGFWERLFDILQI